MDLIPVVSSNLAAVDYDSAFGEMQILFRSGREYVYQVPYDLYTIDPADPSRAATTPQSYDPNGNLIPGGERFRW